MPFFILFRRYCRIAFGYMRSILASSKCVSVACPHPYTASAPRRPKPVQRSISAACGSIRAVPEAFLLNGKAPSENRQNPQSRRQEAARLPLLRASPGASGTARKSARFRTERPQRRGVPRTANTADRYIRQNSNASPNNPTIFCVSSASVSVPLSVSQKHNGRQDKRHKLRRGRRQPDAVHSKNRGKYKHRDQHKHKRTRKCEDRRHYAV